MVSCSLTSIRVKAASKGGRRILTQSPVLSGRLPVDATYSTSAYAHPDARAARPEEIGKLVDFLQIRNVLVLTGAGISTGSGIPDYRSPTGSYSKVRTFYYARARLEFVVCYSPDWLGSTGVRHKPMTHQEFTRSESKRKRYWARAVVASDFFYRLKPNAAHFALAQLEAQGFISAIITQNVDRLHQAAGSKNVTELHGHSGSVVCLNCAAEFPRQQYQSRLGEVNKQWYQENADMDDPVLRADGDAELSQADFESFQVLGCELCGGVLMPKIVFFGGTVPLAVREKATRLVTACERLLVVGSSVAVFSSFRLCREARNLGKDLCILNVGETRADSIATLKLEAEVEDTLSRAAALV